MLASAIDFVRKPIAWSPKPISWLRVMDAFSRLVVLSLKTVDALVLFLFACCLCLLLSITLP